MSDIINGYTLLSPLQNQDAGFSRWTIVEKDGKEYFLKEFLNPVYPDEETLSTNLKQKRIQDCIDFENEKKKTYERVNLSSDGNIVRILDFFRSDSHYYVVTPKITDNKLSFKEISERSEEDKILLCKTVLHSVANFHDVQVIHSDIKGSNILISKSKRDKLVGKIIDFDGSFLEGNTTLDEDELEGDQVYLAPEACKFIFGEDVELTCKIDVFALGLIMHQYWTGNLPGYDESEYDYPHEAVLDDQELILAVLDDQELILSDQLPEDIADMIHGMLACEPEDRISSREAFNLLNKYDKKRLGLLDKEDTIKLPPVPEKEETGNSEPKSMPSWFSQAGDL